LIPPFRVNIDRYAHCPNANNEAECLNADHLGTDGRLCRWDAKLTSRAGAYRYHRGMRSSAYDPDALVTAWPEHAEAVTAPFVLGEGRLIGESDVSLLAPGATTAAQNDPSPVGVLDTWNF
jgi:hypothetical protein